MSLEAAGARMCSSCGYANFGTQETCLHCAWPVAAVRVELSGTVVMAEDAATGSCPTCGSAVGAVDRFCASCGNALA